MSQTRWSIQSSQARTLLLSLTSCTLLLLCLMLYSPLSTAQTVMLMWENHLIVVIVALVFVNVVLVDVNYYNHNQMQSMVSHNNR